MKSIFLVIRNARERGGVLAVVQVCLLSGANYYVPVRRAADVGRRCMGVVGQLGQRDRVGIVTMHNIISFLLMNFSLPHWFVGNV